MKFVSSIHVASRARSLNARRSRSFAYSRSRQFVTAGSLSDFATATEGPIANIDFRYIHYSVA